MNKFFDNTFPSAIKKSLQKLHRKNDPETSVKAAKSNSSSANKLILNALQIKRIEHEDGFTASDLTILTGLDRDTVTPALSRLQTANLVKKMEYTKKPVLDSSKKKQQQVWKIK